MEGDGGAWEGCYGVAGGGVGFQKWIASVGRNVVDIVLCHQFEASQFKV